MSVILDKETVLVTRDSQADSLAIIEFKRSKELNSFCTEQYRDLAAALDAVDADNSISCAVLTGKGRFYSSGHDLRQQMKSQANSGDNHKDFLKDMINQNANSLIQAMIRFEKPLVAAVNGPAVGVACTTLQLCDIVYCAQSANFHVPFMQLGFCAEGCSSLLFPMVMGFSKANEMLLMGKKMTCEEAKQCGFVSDVFPNDSFFDEVLTRARKMASFPPNALRQTKGLTRDAMRQQLVETSDRELDLLLERFVSDECINAVMKFVMEQKARKAKARL